MLRKCLTFSLKKIDFLIWSRVFQFQGTTEASLESHFFKNRINIARQRLWFYFANKRQKLFLQNVRVKLLFKSKYFIHQTLQKPAASAFTGSKSTEAGRTDNFRPHAITQNITAVVLIFP